MTTSPYDQAIAAWLRPQTVRLQGEARAIPDKAQVREEAGERTPTPDEEAALRRCVESANVAEHDWGVLCVLADRIRLHRAETELGDEASAQIAGAESFLDLGHDDFLRWPWGGLDGLVGGMAPGTLHFVVCPSKGGKTTLCRSGTAEWIRAGKRIYYAGLEMTAPMLRTMYAADDVGIDPGDVVTGKWLEFEHYGFLKERMAQAYRSQMDPQSPYQNLRFSNVQNVTKHDIERMMGQAADWGAPAFIIDHLDHVDSAGDGGYGGVQATMHALNRLAEQYRVTVIGTSQMNTTGKSQDVWRDHRPLRLEHVKYGSLKLEIATTMVGFYRPLRPGMVKEDRQRVEAGERTVWDYIWPNVNAANLMASRPYGSRIGQKTFLAWERGRIVDPPPSLQNEIEAGQHGIRTSRGP